MKNLASFIDHTLLKPSTTKEQIIKICEEAEEYHFASVCIPPCFVKTAYSVLKGQIPVCTVIGFPLGYQKKEVKLFEVEKALEDGAEELDMVMNLTAFFSQNDLIVYEEIKAIKEKMGKKVLKVIIEICLLTEEQKKKACDICVKAGADFVKTSTGFSLHGASLEDVALLKKSVQGFCLVKASGGIKDRKTALEMIAIGADRIGTSSGVEIVS